MKTKNLGILSALFASVCCLGPLILALIGLSSLGLGRIVGKYHWWFLGAGILLIIIAWTNYFKEKRACDLKACQMENKRITQIILTFATLIVVFFVSLNLYTYLGKATDINEITTIANTKTTIISVEGMTCLSCEIRITSALKKINGVINASASAKEKTVTVKYDPNKTNINQLIAAINKTGYKASLQK